MTNLTTHSEFPPPKPTVGFEAAEAQLLADLSGAMKLIGEQNQTRDGMIGALQAVIWFLNGRGVSGQQIWPLEHLRRELEFIFRGKRSPILQPGVNSRDDITAIRHGGPAKEEVRVFAAACSEAVYRLGRTSNLDSFPKRVRNEADQLVASKVSKWPSFDNGNFSARTIKSWRDNLRTRGDVDGLLTAFMRDEVGRRQLEQVLREGPPHIGGF